MVGVGRGRRWIARVQRVVRARWLLRFLLLVLLLLLLQLLLVSIRLADHLRFWVVMLLVVVWLRVGECERWRWVGGDFKIESNLDQTFLHPVQTIQHQSLESQVAKSTFLRNQRTS